MKSILSFVLLTVAAHASQLHPAHSNPTVAPTQHQALAAAAHEALITPTPTLPPHWRELAKRDVTQTCGYWGTTFSWICSKPDEYCGYDQGGGLFACYQYNNNGSIIATPTNIRTCLDASQYSATCLSASTACPPPTGWCSNGSLSKCVTYEIVATGTYGGSSYSYLYSNFKCGSVAMIFTGSPTLVATVVTASSVSSATSISSTFSSASGDTSTRSATLTIPASASSTSSSISSPSPTSTSTSTGSTSSSTSSATIIPSNSNGLTSDSSGPSKGTIAGTVIGSVLGTALIVAAAVYIRHRVVQKRAERMHGDVPVMTGEVMDISRRQ